MRCILSSIFALFIFTSLFAQNNAITVLHLNGSISNRYPFQMVLRITESNVKGYYYYEQYRTKILLEGKLKGEEIRLTESPDFEGEFKKGFKGIFSKNKLSGVWINLENDKSLGFNATVTTESQRGVEDISEISGLYENELNSENYDSSILLDYIANNIYAFEITNGTTTGCMGYLNGVVEIKNESSGTYTADGCDKLSFRLSRFALTLEEDQCEFHGLRCPFSGKYKK
ncbi:hypothetical protein [Fulvivirga ligni]|uniref:hypothetical protein n=1 Tax=Fulvivirga ligni TaxID=2904246 RepID=UPI001F2022EB|nr:hypothetical protein [Fulvivirga ligni]UII20248.1 hypothetical protein LVD16_20605 [Fulvivirga ligni]